jgi:hypothetical protein
VKAWLSQAGIAFTTRNVELDLDAYHELIARGFRTVPVTVIGEGDAAVSITGYNETALKDALGMAP